MKVMAEEDGIRAEYRAARVTVSNTLHALRVWNVFNMDSIPPELNQFQDKDLLVRWCHQS